MWVLKKCGCKKRRRRRTGVKKKKNVPPLAAVSNDVAVEQLFKKCISRKMIIKRNFMYMFRSFLSFLSHFSKLYFQVIYMRGKQVLFSCGADGCLHFFDVSKHRRLLSIHAAHKKYEKTYKK